MVYISISVSGACEGTSLRLLEQLHFWPCINIELRNLSPVILCAVNLFNISDYSRYFFWNKLKNSESYNNV